MQITTRKAVLAALMASLAVSLAAPMASAQGTRSACVLTPDGMRKCDGQPAQKASGQTAQPSQRATGQRTATPSRSSAPTQPASKKAAAPHVGESARKGALFQQARNSRLPAPPAHQHYRVLDDTIVRVDDSTLKVVAVVGLVSALLATN